MFYLLAQLSTLFFPFFLKLQFVFHAVLFSLFFLVMFQVALTLQSSQDYFIFRVTSGREGTVPVLGKTLDLSDRIVSFVKWK